MLFYLAATLCILAICTIKYVKSRKIMERGSKEIPVEKGLPIFGILSKIEKPMFNYLVKLSKKHGPIYQISIGMRNVVVLNSFEFIKTAMVENGEAFSGRWKAMKYVMVAENSGLVFIDGTVWAEQRSFVLKTLREFGFGRSRSMDIIRDECARLLEDLDKKRGTPFKLPKFLYTYTLNVISKFVMNKRFSHGDRELEILDKFMQTVATQDDPVSTVLMMFPFLENTEWLVKFIIWVTSRKSILDDCHRFIEKEITERSSKIDFNGEGEDLLDKFLIKQHQMRRKNGRVETFTNFQFVRNALEMMTGGYDTTSTILVWGFMFMAMYQEVQDKVCQEIWDQIGPERMLTVTDKLSLQYTQAVLDEIMRLSCVFPISILHRTLADVTVKGYFIPKDTIIIPNLLANHLDPSIWEKPFEFHPGHFLSTNSAGELKYQPSEHLIVFGMGKRTCIGESLARMEYFVFFTNVLQRFRINLAKKEADFDAFQSNDGLIRTPLVEDFIFTRRNLD